MITEASKHPIPGISQEALVRAAALAETDTSIGRFYNDEDVEMVRLRIVESGLCFEAASPSLLVAAMIDELAAQRLMNWELQAQIDALRTGSSDHG